jgi:hypothetical protein
LVEANDILDKMTYAFANPSAADLGHLLDEEDRQGCVD